MHMVSIVFKSTVDEQRLCFINYWLDDTSYKHFTNMMGMKTKTIYCLECNLFHDSQLSSKQWRQFINFNVWTSHKIYKSFIYFYFWVRDFICVFFIYPNYAEKYIQLMHAFFFWWEVSLNRFIIDNSNLNFSGNIKPTYLQVQYDIHVSKLMINVCSYI